MANFTKRFITAIPLILILCIALINNLVLFFLLVIVGYVVLIEFLKLFQKIFFNNNIKIIISFIICLIYLSIFLSQMYFFVINDLNNKIIFIYFLSICIATDLGGYIFGKTFKGKKIGKISPNKTYSGIIGSYFFSLIVFIFFNFQFSFDFNFILISLLISTISQAGDLFISLLKRKANVKDTGSLLPGHGGILDRIDGIIVAIPIGINLIHLFK